jgi:hypothetical protein
MSVANHSARFVAAADLIETVSGLRATEQLFYDLMDRLSEEEEAWDWKSGKPFQTRATRDAAFVDPAFL